MLSGSCRTASDLDGWDQCCVRVFMLHSVAIFNPNISECHLCAILHGIQELSEFALWFLGARNSSHRQPQVKLLFCSWRKPSFIQGLVQVSMPKFRQGQTNLSWINYQNKWIETARLASCCCVANCRDWCILQIIIPWYWVPVQPFSNAQMSAESYVETPISAHAQFRALATDFFGFLPEFLIHSFHLHPRSYWHVSAFNFAMYVQYVIMRVIHGYTI